MCRIVPAARNVGPELESSCPGGAIGTSRHELPGESQGPPLFTDEGQTYKNTVLQQEPPQLFVVSTITGVHSNQDLIW